MLFADKLLTGSKNSSSHRVQHVSTSSSPSASSTVCIEEALSNDLKVVWALKGRWKATKFSVNQKNFLSDIFEQGEKTKQKEDPKNVSAVMRNARDAHGNKMFTPSGYLRKEQIASFFSRLATGKQRGKPQQIEEELGRRIRC